MVYNPSDGKIIVNRMFLDKKKQSSYILNIDGETLLGEMNLEIDPNDSVYLFIQAKLKEQGVDTALEYKENLVLEYNGFTDKIPVISFGQDVNRLYGETISTQSWSGAKPYLIYDSLYIPKGQTLIIEEGVTVYCHASAKIVAEGELHCIGTRENPVWFRPDNLDTSYNEVPHQWGSIVLKNNSVQYTFEHTIIKGATNGIIAVFDNYSPAQSIVIANSKIEYAGYGGIIAHNANISAVNFLSVHNSGYGISISGNGKHSYIHSTISQESVIISKGYKYLKIQDSAISNQLDIFFGNSIVSGKKPGDVAIDFPDDSITNWNATFDHCAVAANQADYGKDYFVDCKLITDTSTLFKNDSEPEFLLGSGSVARNTGSSEVMGEYTQDYRGNERNSDGVPDAGAYEYFSDNAED